jgi:hypothetical protein
MAGRAAPKRIEPARIHRSPIHTVLYVADLWQLLPDDARRKGRSTPLEWGKFRSPADVSDEGIRYQMRRGAVKATPGPEGFAILGVFDELLIHYGFARTAALRGWLINHDYQSATVAQIGQTVGCADVRFLARALKVLESAGLLVRTELPDLAQAIHEDRTVYPKGVQRLPTSQPPVGPPPEEIQPQAGPPPANGQPPAGQRPDGGRPAAGIPPGHIKTLKTQDSETRDSQTPDTQTPTPASPSSADGNGKTGRDRDSETATALPLPPDNSQATVETEPPTSDEGTAYAPAGPCPPLDGQARASPTATPPIAEPPIAEPPRVPTEADPPSGQRLAIAEDAEQVAARIYLLLYPTREAVVMAARRGGSRGEAIAPEEFEAREIGCLRSVWGKVTGGWPLATIEMVYRKAVKYAERIARRRRSPKKTNGAIFVHWLERYAATFTEDGSRE